MKDGKLGFGIAGCGVIAPWHVKGVEACDKAYVVAAASRNAERARKFAEEHGIPRHYDSYEALVRDDEVDVVCVCVPSGKHAEVGIMAAQEGKHVLCEKPIEVTVKAARRLIDACRDNGVKLGVVFQSRTYDSVKKTREAVQSGVLGRMVLGDVYIKWFRSKEYYRSGAWRGTWELDGGGALMNQGVHGIDVLLWVMGEVESVFARCDHLVHDIEVEDTAVAVLKYANGAFGVIEGTTSCNPGEPAVHMFHGEKGSITLREAKIARWAVAGEGEETARDVEEMVEKGAGTGGASDPKAISAEGHIKLVADMVDAVLNDREPMIPGEEAIRSVELINAVYLSAREGREVNIEEIRGGG